MNQKFDYYDIVIIGGSLAGNYLGYLLSKLNLTIAIIEEHDKIGFPFQCAGIVSKKLGKLIDLKPTLVLNRVNVAKLVSSSGKSIKLSGDEEPYIIDRIELDLFFYNKIKENENIIYYLGEKFKNFSYVNDSSENLLLIETSKRHLRAKMLVGCDGPLSRVAELLRIRHKLLYATQIRIKGNFNENEAVMYFDPQWKELFGWIVPEGNSIYRIGLASASNISKNFQSFINRLNININKKIDQQGGILPYGLMNKCAFNNILLLGDAASQVKSTTGGGIIMLLTAAKYAAYCIKTCFQINDFSQKTIKKLYENLCKVSIGKQLKIHYIIRMILERFTDDDFDTFFKIIKTSRVEHLISLYGDMDFPRSLAFKLLKNSLVIKFLIKFFLKNPTFVLKLFKLILKS